MCCQQQIVSVKTEVVNPQTPGVSFFVPTVFGEREHDLRLFIIVRRKRVDNSVVVVLPVLESLLFHKVEGAVLHSAFDEVQVLRLVCAFESDDGVQLEQIPDPILCGHVQGRQNGGNEGNYACLHRAWLHLGEGLITASDGKQVHFLDVDLHGGGSCVAFCDNAAYNVGLLFLSACRTAAAG